MGKATLNVPEIDLQLELDELHKRMPWTQIAEALGVSVKTVHRWKAGMNVPQSRHTYVLLKKFKDKREKAEAGG